MSGFGRAFADLKRRLTGGSRLRQYTLAAPVAVTPEMSDIERMFLANKGSVVHKWLHYLPIYNRYLSKYRGTDVKVLAIGLCNGGSLHLWREYLGPQATIFGIDINSECASVDGVDGQVRIGSQADPTFLARVVAEMGGVDIVLDDGSHIRASLDTLYPLLAPNGLYLIEDVHTAYSRRYDGRFSRHNFMRLLGRLIDDRNHWYHADGQPLAASADQLLGLHIHDGLVVLEKGNKVPLAHNQVGSAAAQALSSSARSGIQGESLLETSK